MCGIAGIVRPTGGPPGETDRVRAMLAAMAHRGPDEVRVTALPGATVGVARLAVVDGARSSQPMGDRDSGIHLVFNGFVSNFVELRRTLAEEGETFATSGDTEVLLRVLVRRWDGGPELLDGMFAFAAHDPGRRRTLLARDPFGVKPLYVAKDGDAFLFASEARGLLAALPGRPVVDREALLEYLAFQVPLGDRTLYRGVRRLPPGTLLEVDGDGVRERRWWWPPVPGSRPLPFRDAAEALRAAAGESVQRSLRADLPVGVCLSGGLDSSLVAALAAPGGDRVAAHFHGAYDAGPAYDERVHARCAAAGLPAPLRETVIAPAAVAEHLPRIARDLDEPMAGPGVIGTWFVAREASDSVRVLLGGHGADEVFSGYARHLAVEFGQALGGAAAGDVGSLLTLLPRLGALRGYEPLVAGCFAGGDPFPPPEERFFRTVFRGGGLEDVLQPDVVAELADWGPRKRFAAVFPGAAAGDLRARMAEFERRVLLPALLHVEDRATMAHGVESRVPLLGREVVEGALALAPEVRWEGGGLKPLLREVARPLVAAAVLAREDKMGFPVPLAPWSRGPLREFVGDLLLCDGARRRGLWRPQAVEGLLRGEGIDGRRLWALLSVELWFRECVRA